MFASPAVFWALLLAGPALLALYLVRQQTHTFVVPSIFYLADLPPARISARKRLRRFVSDPLFYIQMFLLLFLLAALAEPVRTSPVKNVTVIIDVTASMQAIEGSNTRLEVARKAARKLIAALEPSSRVILFTAGGSLARISGPTAAKPELLKSLSGIRGTDVPGNPTDAVYAALNAILPFGGGDIVFFTDAPMDISRDLIAENVSLRVVPIGSARSNVAIVSFESPSGMFSPVRSLVAQLRNFSPDAVSAIAVLSFDGAEFARQKVRLAPQGVQTLSFELAGRSGVAKLELRLQDALRTDDSASLFVPPSNPVEITIVSPEKRVLKFLERPGMFKLQHFTSAPNSQSPAGENRIFIFVHSCPHRPVPGNAILLSPAEDSYLFHFRGRGKGAPVFWEPDHPLIEQLSVDNLEYETFSLLDFQAPLQTLIRARQAPLLAVFEAPLSRVAVCAMPLDRMLDSRSGAFLLFRLLQWCSPRSPAQRPLQPGDPISLHGFSPGTTLRIIPPGAPEFLAAPDSQSFVFTQTQRVGIYRFESGDFRSVRAVNLSSAFESDLRQRPEETVIVAKAKPAAELRSSYTASLLLLLPLLLLFEWWAFHARQKRFEEPAP